MSSADSSAGSPLPGVDGKLFDVAAMTLLDDGLLFLAAADMPGRQDLVVIVERGQPEAEFETSAREDLLQRRDAWLPLSALDPGDLGLRHPGPFGQNAWTGRPPVVPAAGTHSRWSAAYSSCTHDSRLVIDAERGHE